MHWRNLVLAIAGFLLAIVSEGLVRRAIALVLCGVFSFNSMACYQTGERAIAQIPRIRKPSLELPEDFRVVSQVPFSSGKREILLVSSSTGAEQVYSTSLPDASQFELFGVEFRKVSGVDVRPLLVGKEIQLEPTEVEASLKTFKVLLKNNELSRVILANGIRAEFSGSQAIIKSSKGAELERIQLSSATMSSAPVAQLEGKIKSLENVSGSFKRNKPFMIAQASSASCQSGAKSYLQNSSQQMLRVGDQLVDHGSKNSLLIGGALKFSNVSLQNNSISKEFSDTVCQAPVQCNEEVISGGSEIRTDLFKVPQGSDRKVTINYEFYQIPDRLEMSFDGKSVLIIGPASGRSAQTFSFPNGAKYVGVKLIGNQENRATKWWYKVACSGELCPANSTVPTRSLSGTLDRRSQTLGQGDDQKSSNTQCPSCESILIEALPSEKEVSRMKTFAKDTIPLLLKTAKEAGITDPRQIAYILATAQHESFLGRTMTETEDYAKKQNYDRNSCNFVAGKAIPGNGVKYRGRGFVHLTHKCNYEKWQSRLNSEFKDRFGGQLDLVNNPDLAAKPEISAVISVYGMRDGSFKSQAHSSIHKLQTYFNSEREDYFNARAIINNPKNEDRTVVEKIGNLAEKYSNILKKCEQPQ